MQDDEQQPGDKPKWHLALQRQLLARVLRDPEFLDLNARALKASNFENEFCRAAMVRVWEHVEKYGQAPGIGVFSTIIEEEARRAKGNATSTGWREFVAEIAEVKETDADAAFMRDHLSEWARAQSVKRLALDLAEMVEEANKTGEPVDADKIQGLTDD